MELVDLTKLEDNKLVTNVVENNSFSNESLEELSRRHTPLCVNIYNKYTGIIHSSGQHFRDIVDQKLHVIYKACTSFDKDKGIKFSSWLGNMVRYQCLTAISSSQKGTYISIDDEDVSSTIESQVSTETNFDKAEFFEYCMHLVGQMKDPRIKTIFQKRYSDKEETWDEIASTLGISAQAVINIHEKALQLIKQKLISDEMSDKI